MVDFSHANGDNDKDTKREQKKRLMPTSVAFFCIENRAANRRLYGVLPAYSNFL